MAPLSKRILTLFVLAALLPFLTGATIVIRGPRVPAAGGGSPALIASLGEPGNVNGFTTASINTAAANLIVVTVAYYGSEPTLSDSKTNSYNGLTARTTGSSQYIRQYWVQGASVGDSSHTFTLTGSNTYPSIVVLAFSNISAAPADQENSAVNGGWTTFSVGSITPSQANTVAVAGLEYYTEAGTIGVGAEGYTLGPVVAPVVAERMGCAVAYKILSSASAQNMSFTSSVSTNIGVSSHTNYKY